MAEPLNLEGFVGLTDDRLCTIEASCATGFEPMVQEEVKVCFKNRLFRIEHLKTTFLVSFCMNKTIYNYDGLILFFGLSI